MLKQPYSEAPSVAAAVIAPGVVQVSIQRESVLNALDIATAIALREVCKRALAEPDTRVLVLRGTPRAFSVGGDTAFMREDPVGNSRRIVEPLHALIQELADAPIPVVAALEGVVAGGAVGLALACDLVLATSTTRFNLAYSRIGASCDCGASWVLPRLLGWRRALHLLTVEPEFNAGEALQWGLVDRVLEASEFDRALIDQCKRLIEIPRKSFAEIKRLTRQSIAHELPAQLQREAEAFARCAASEDFKEGLAAFAERRAPRFGA